VPSPYLIGLEAVMLALFLVCLRHAVRDGAPAVNLLVAGVLFGLLLEWATIQQLQAYSYGRYLAMLGDVPLAIGVGWGTIIYGARLFSDRTSLPAWARPVLDGLLALNVDLAMDATAIPLCLPARIAGWMSPDKSGPEAFEVFLASQSLARSVSTADSDSRLRPFSTVRQTAAQVALDRQRAANADDKQLLALAYEEIKKLQADLQRQRQDDDALIAIAEQERKDAEERADQSQARVLALNKRIASLEAKLETAGASTAVEIPSDLEGFQDWCDEHLAGCVLVTNRAVRAVKKSEYEDTSLIYRALLLPRSPPASAWRSGSGSRSGWAWACRWPGPPASARAGRGSGGWPSRRRWGRCRPARPSTGPGRRTGRAP
jgi:hypothetical protein